MVDIHWRHSPCSIVRSAAVGASPSDTLAMMSAQRGSVEFNLGIVRAGLPGGAGLIPAPTGPSGLEAGSGCAVSRSVGDEAGDARVCDSDDVGSSLLA